VVILAYKIVVSELISIYDVPIFKAHQPLKESKFQSSMQDERLRPARKGILIPTRIEGCPKKAVGVNRRYRAVLSKYCVKGVFLSVFPSRFPKKVHVTPSMLNERSYRVTHWSTLALPCV
jgi:hypothetical protein